MTIHLLLILAALICTGLCAIGVATSRVHLGWLGVFFFLLSLVTGA